MTGHTLKSAAAAICALVFLYCASAQASTDQLRADAYFNAIAGGDADTITSFYDDKAEFHWVGGPLAGVYTGKAQIKAVWKRFVDAAGELDYKVVELTESRNGKITTVTARVDFIGPTNLPVKFVLMYENGKIVKEIWQVEKPTTFAGSDPAPQQPSPETTTATAATMTVQAPPTPEKVAVAPAGPPAAPEDAPPVSLNAVTVAPAAPPPARKATLPVVAAAPAEPADDPEGAPPMSLNAVTVAPAAPSAVSKAAATPVPQKPKAKVAKKVKKKTYSDYEDDYDDDDYYDYRPRRRFYGYGSPLRFRYGYRYYVD